MLAMAGTADVVINNTDGGLRVDLPAGPLTYGRLFDVFPFNNQLVELATRMKGNEYATYLLDVAATPEP